MKPKFVATHPIGQTEMPASPDSRITNTPAIKILCPTKIVTLCISVQTARV
jgi:hypothetical protein